MIKCFLLVALLYSLLLITRLFWSWRLPLRFHLESCLPVLLLPPPLLPYPLLCHPSYLLASWHPPRPFSLPLSPLLPCVPFHQFHLSFSFRLSLSSHMFPLHEPQHRKYYLSPICCRIWFQISPARFQNQHGQNCHICKENHQQHNQGCRSLGGPILLCRLGCRFAWLSTHPCEQDCLS